MHLTAPRVAESSLHRDRQGVEALDAVATAQRKRWTPAEEQQLTSAAKERHGQDLMDVFERFASQRGVSPSTVRSKYYALKKPRKGGRGSWSKRAANQLVREASAVSGRERTTVFEEWAQRRGTSVGAIRQKYYLLTASAQQATPAPRTSSPAPAPKRTAATSIPSAKVNGNANGTGRPSASVDDQLVNLTMLELAQLGRRVSDELERRIASVSSLWV